MNLPYVDYVVDADADDDRQRGLDCYQEKERRLDGASEYGLEQRLSAAVAAEEEYDAGDDDDDDVEVQASDDAVAEEAVEEAGLAEIADESLTHDAATPYWQPLPVAVDDVHDASASVVVAVAAYFDAEYAIGEVNSGVAVAVQMVIVDDVASLFGVQSTAIRPLSRFYGVYSELFVVVSVAVVDAAADSNLVPIQSMANYFHSTLIF